MVGDPSRRILASNLNKLIDAALLPGEKRSVRAWALSKGLDVRLIDRLVKGQHAVTLDKLEEIAEACGLKPWHLLYEGFDPHALPDAPISAEDRALLHKLRKLLNSR
jgi:hypothetical protein